MSSLRTVAARGLIALPLVAGIAVAQPAFAAHHSSHHASGKTYVVKEVPDKNGTYSFSPAKLTIHVGDTVKWVDANSTPHNIVGVGSAARIISRTDVDTKPYQVTFKSAGTYDYECQVHLPNMKGQIVVQSASSSSSHKTYTVKEQPGKNGTYVFNPAKLTIHVGDTVKWVDVNSTIHNIVGTDSASKKVIDRSAYSTKTYQVTFKSAGTYHYECQIHLPIMKGEIIVKK